MKFGGHNDVEVIQRKLEKYIYIIIKIIPGFRCISSLYCNKAMKYI